MRSIVSLAALVACAAPAMAAEMTPGSRVTGVVVFPSGAEVRRTVNVRIEPGDHEIVLSDLPQQAQPGSIRVEGKASGPMTLGAVDSRRLSVARQDAERAASERRRLEDELDSLRDERARAGGEGQAAEARRSFAQNLAQMPGRPVAAGVSGPGREDWGSLGELIVREMTAAQGAQLQSEIKVREVDRRIKDVERRLREEAPRAETRTQVRVQVSAAAAIDAELTVRYNVAEAGWSPLYDARLATGTRTQTAKLVLTRRAVVTQRTSEPWPGVALSLSTTRPTAGTAAPDLSPLTVDFVPDRPPPPPAPVAMAPRSAPAEGADQMTRSRLIAGKLADAPSQLEEASVQRAEAQISAFQAVYDVAGAQTVANTGDPRRVTIDQSEIDPQLVVRSAPRVDQRAFLYAKIAIPRTMPIVAGSVALFRDGTFVGNGVLPQLAGGEDHELGFGADDRVRVRSSVVEDKRGESGIISSAKSEQKSWRFAIKSLHERPIAFTIQDQAPVSGNQDIKVELIGRAPARRDIDDRRGVLAWDDRLGPDEEKTIEFGYRVSWPGAKSILYRR